MFIKLTRLDNSPIWLNASFVVTVEPRRGGGSVVVPIGDGLDYDVKESPERVLAALAGAPEPAVVPVPTRDALTQTPDDVSPEPERPEPPAAEPPKAEPPKAEPPKTEAPKGEAPKADEVKITVSEAPEEPAAKPKAVRKTRTRAKAKPKADEAAEGDAADEKPKPVRKTRTRTKKTPLALDDAQLERLLKLRPRSVRKLINTLASQFKVEDGETQVKALVEHGVISIDQDHVIWPS